MKKLMLTLLIAILALSACVFTTGEKVRGNGNITSSTRTPGNFNSVEQKGSWDVELLIGDQSQVVLEGEENIISKIETYVDGNTLKIRSEEGFNLQPRRSVRILITAPSYKKVYSHGSGNISSESLLKNDDAIDVATHGSGNITLQIMAPEVKATVQGSGDVTLKGETRKVIFECSGSGDLKAIDLQAEEAYVDIMGSGNAGVNPSKSLKVEVKGSGDVTYKGNPSISSDIKGSGNIKKLD